MLTGSRVSMAGIAVVVAVVGAKSVDSEHALPLLMLLAAVVTALAQQTLP